MWRSYLVVFVEGYSLDNDIASTAIKRQATVAAETLRRTQRVVSTDAMDLREAITRLRRARTNLTQGEVAMEAGIDPGGLSRILNGEQSITLTQLEALAKAVNASVTEITAIAEGLFNENGNDLAAILKAPKGYCVIKQLNVEGSAGYGRKSDVEEVIDQLWVKETWLRTALGVASANLAVITASGDSMSPTIGDGDPLLIDKAVEKVKGNQVYALNWDGDLITKRVQKMLNGDLLIVSDNPAYKEERASRADADQLIVVGRVVWVWRGMKL